MEFPSRHDNELKFSMKFCKHKNLNVKKFIFKMFGMSIRAIFGLSFEEALWPTSANAKFVKENLLNSLKCATHQASECISMRASTRSTIKLEHNKEKGRICEDFKWSNARGFRLSRKFVGVIRRLSASFKSSAQASKYSRKEFPTTNVLRHHQTSELLAYSHFSRLANS